ncbi:MAG: CotH kinase family protein [Clostridia bacterium]|nr:CotH kinase family protein [Clostridia bacterium]
MNKSGIRYKNIYRVISLLMACIIISGIAGCRNNKSSDNGDAPMETTNITDNSSSMLENETDDESMTTGPTAGMTGSSESASSVGTEGSAKPTGSNESTLHTSVSASTSTNKPISTAESTQPSASEVVFERMPVLKITTHNYAGINSKDVYVKCSISSEHCPEEYAFEDKSAGIRLRGNSTADADKKPYRIKFDKKQSMFGLNDGAKCKSWCLMADYFDHSMLRTYTTFNLGGTLLGDKYFCSDSMHVEVYINNAYMGVYLLCEQSQINPNRVDIYEKSDSDTSLEIGYLMIGQGGRTDEEDSIVVSVDGEITDLNGDVNYTEGLNFSLSGGPYTEEQKKYIEKYASNALNIVWNAIYKEKYYYLDSNGDKVEKKSFPSSYTTEQKQRETIGSVMNLDSAVRMYILDEIVKNFDAGTFNMYMDLSPTGEKKITFGPPWDFDFAMGNSKYASTNSSLGIYAANFTYSDGIRTNFLFVMLYGVRWFREDVSKVWRENYDALMADIAEIKTVTEFGKDQFASNYVRWHTLGEYTMEHQAEHVLTFKTHADAANYLYDWLISRMNYINSVWSKGVFESPYPNGDSLSIIDFSKSESMNYISDYSCCYASLQSDSLKLTVNDNYDPYFSVDYTKSTLYINANTNKTLKITYMIPESNAYSEYGCELFFVTGDMQHAEAGKSVTFNMKADGQYHTKVIDLSYVPFWRAAVNSIRVDFFYDSVVGDVFYIKDLTISK